MAPNKIHKNINIGRYCCDPFKKHKQKITKHIRFATKKIIDKNSSLYLTTKHRVCRSCREKLENPEPSPEISEEEINASPEELQNEFELSQLNESLATLNEISPLKKSRLSTENPQYIKNKFQKVETSIKRKFESISGQSFSSENHTNGESEIIQQLKEKFNEASSRSEKLTILTILPKSWTRSEIMETFKCSQYMARQAKNLVKEKGILSTPNPHLGKNLHPETTEIVRNFFYSPEISREMPGLKDYISVKKSDGCREKKQKHLVLCNLKEAFQNFKSEHPTLKIGFSKFAELRPKECVLAGSSGTHSVCVCTKHQNVKLMMEAIKKVFKNVSDFDQDAPDVSTSTWNDGLDTSYICHYRHCLALLQCNPPQEKCYFGECEYCPKKEEFTDLITTAFDKKGLDEVEFRHWISTDRSTLEYRKLSAEEFINDFYEQLKVLLMHDFFAKSQAAFMRHKKDELREGEFLVVGDFAENYSFIVQDAVQSFHWNNNQATLHPFVVYYRDNNELIHKSFVAISDCNRHDVIAVHLFQTRLINYLKSSHSISKIFYFIDGCAAQYKNCKNFLNLCYHKEDFEIDAEWHFFATSHGKGPCDGVGGSVKRLAARTSLHQTGGAEPILNPLALYNFAVTALPTVSFTFTTSEEHETHKLMLEKRLDTARTIPGTNTNFKLYNVINVCHFM